MNAPLIPQANPGAAFRSRRDALLKAAADVLDGGWYINGKQVRQFEESFATFCSVKHAVGVGNGTDAIEVALRALGIGKGGLVFTVCPIPPSRPSPPSNAQERRPYSWTSIR